MKSILLLFLFMSYWVENIIYTDNPSIGVLGDSLSSRNLDVKSKLIFQRYRQDDILDKVARVIEF